MNAQPNSILIFSRKNVLDDIFQTIDPAAEMDVQTIESKSDLGPYLATHQCQLALIIHNSGDERETDILSEIKDASPETECIILVKTFDSTKAEATLKAGAFAYLPEDCKVTCLKSAIRNALRQQELTRALVMSRKKYTQIFENTKDGIVSVSLEGAITGFNQAFLDIVGYDSQEISQMTFYDLTPERWHVDEKALLDEEVIPKGYAELYEKEYIHKDGSRIPIEVSAHLSTDSKGNPTGFWAFVRNISKRKASEAALRQQLKEVMILQDLTSAGASATDVDELLQEATHILGESLYPENFGIFTFDSKEKILRRHYSYQTNAVHDEFNGSILREDEGIIGRAFRTRAPQCVADVRKDPDFLRGYNEALSEIAIPIFVNDDVFGVINAESEIAGRFTDDDAKLLITMANQLSTSIEKIQYHNAQDQRVKEISGLYETAIATASLTDTDMLYRKIYEHALDLFPLDTFSIVEYEPHDETIRVAFLMEEGKPMKKWLGTRYEKDESGLIGWVIRERKPFLAQDLQLETLPVEAPSSERPARAWLGVPLIAKGKVVGGLSVQSFAPNAFNKNHQRLLESLAALLAGVIASARLIEQSKNQIARLEALHDIDLVINSSMDLRVTLNILLDQVIEKLKVDAAVVFLFNPQNNMLEHTASHGFRTQAIKQYTLQMGEGISGKAAMERHLIKTLNLLDEDEFPYTDLMQEEQFVSYYSVPLIAKGQVKGVIDIFNRTLLNPDDEWFNFLGTLGGQAAIAIDNSRLLEELHQSNTELRLAYDKTLEGWSKALDLRDRETEGHTQRVVDITLQIAKLMGVADTDQIHIQRGALLHDIGKMGIPDSILLKPGPLTEAEWDIMRMHPEYAYNLIYPIKHLRPALDIPYAHHERWDGSGYPRHLKGENIPLAARIFAVVDVWDALTSDRPYRPAWSAKKALDYIQEQSGKQFDPAIVDLFMSLIKNELISVRGQP